MGMSEVSLDIMLAKLYVIRQLCAPCGDELEDALKLVDEITARSALGLLEIMLFSLTQLERSEFEQRFAQYRELELQELADHYGRVLDQPQFMGVDPDHFESVYEHLRYKEGTEDSVSYAKIEFIHRIFELCAFGFDLLGQKRGHLRLVRPDEG